ncbi:hypothetical protein HDU87_004333 [Geranomyces variabilis]|uniref:Uncharacterized protein n=1 Tax=Geranomyces variabilis TaxID=109894 RepID=A0AAD5XLZ4_9FUNG|nr:hypothetical protein HDU87_004333 [Geranomyces variabilis]
MSQPRTLKPRAFPPPFPQRTGLSSLMPVAANCRKPHTQPKTPPALGNLVYTPGLCGKLLTVTCPGGTPVTAVVASTCNLGSPSCGVDLIDRTWRAATGNKPPGQTQCTVSLATNMNPIQGGGPLCYNRPGTPGSAYYKNLGVLNTGGEIPASALLAGCPRIVVKRFEFNSGGRELFTNDAVVAFTYQSGRTVSFKMQDCRQSAGVQIFK